MTTSNNERPTQWNDRRYQINAAGKGLRFSRGAALNQRSPAIMDHFYYGSGGTMTSANTTPWITHATGTTGNDVPFAILANDPGGSVSGATGTDNNSGQVLAGVNVSWKPSTHAVANPMVLEARLKVTAATNAYEGLFFVGFADAVTYTNDITYVLSAASAITTSAPTDGIFFAHSSVATSGTAFGSTHANPVVAITSANGTDAVTALASGTGGGFTSGQFIHTGSEGYTLYRLEVDASANAAFYINDIFVGSVAAASTPTVALTPYFAAQAIGASAHEVTMTIDYIGVWADLGY